MATVTAQRRIFRVPLAEIAYVRMILEAYDGLAVMTSERGQGIIEWHVGPGMEAEADALARALADECGMRELPAELPQPSPG
jgi:hypothetical protein